MGSSNMRVAKFKFLCSECLRTRQFLEELKARVTADSRWTKQDIIDVLSRNNIHAHTIHRRLYLEQCAAFKKREGCRKTACNFAHGIRQMFLGKILNEYRQAGHNPDLASMENGKDNRRSRETKEPTITANGSSCSNNVFGESNHTNGNGT